MMINGEYASGTPPIAMAYDPGQSDMPEKVKRSWFNWRSPWFWVSLAALKPFQAYGTYWLYTHWALVVKYATIGSKAALAGFFGLLALAG